MGAKSSARLFENLLYPPSCLARRGFLSRAGVSPQDFKRKHGRAIAPPHPYHLLCAHRELDELVAEFGLLEDFLGDVRARLDDDDAVVHLDGTRRLLAE